MCISKMARWCTTIIITIHMRSPAMLDDFFSRALIGGIGVALVAGPPGCFIVWRRMAYFGDTVAHTALLGVALALLLAIDVTLGVFAITATVAFALLLLQRHQALPTDALPGILSHSTLARSEEPTSELKSPKRTSY